MTINCSRCIHGGPAITWGVRDLGIRRCTLHDRTVISDQSCPDAAEDYEYIESRYND